MTDDNASQNSTPWFLDSAASDHVTNDLHHLNSYQPYSGPDQVTIGNGESLPIHHTGKGILPTPRHSFKLNKVLHVPTISSNLLSVQQLAKDNNCSIIFYHSSFASQDKACKAILHKGYHANGLYYFTSSPHALPLTPSTTAAFSTGSSPSAELWHKRLGHPSFSKLQTLKSHLSISLHRDPLSCIDCSVSKCHRLPFKLSNSTVNNPLSLIHSDVWGPFHGSSLVTNFMCCLLMILVDSHGFILFLIKVRCFPSL